MKVYNDSFHSRENDDDILTCAGVSMVHVTDKALETLLVKD